MLGVSEYVPNGTVLLSSPGIILPIAFLSHQMEQLKKVVVAMTTIDIFIGSQASIHQNYNTKLAHIIKTKQFSCL